MPRNPALQVRLPAEAFERLASLRRERHLNVSAWARRVLLAALDRDFPETPPRTPTAAASTGESQLRGWHPARLPDGSWGAACDNPRNLPPQLAGLPIEVQPRQGSPWIATVLEVLEHEPHRVLVRDSGRPTRAS